MKLAKHYIVCGLAISTIIGGCNVIDGPELRAEERLAVEEILRLNGLDTLNWERVASDRDIDGKKTGHIQKLVLYDRKIDTIPPSIGVLIHVKSIAFEDNQLEGLPLELIGLKPLPGEVNLKRNRLCVIPIPIRNWLDEYAAGWEEGQKCP